MEYSLSFYDKLGGKILLSILIAVFLGLIGFYVFPISKLFSLFYPPPDSNGTVPFLRGSSDVPVIIWYLFMLCALLHSRISEGDMLVFKTGGQLAQIFFFLAPFGLIIIVPFFNLLAIGSIIFLESWVVIDGPISSFINQLTERQLFAAGSFCSFWAILPLVDGLIEELRNREKVQ